MKVVVIVIVSKVEISLVTSEEERIPTVGGIKWIMTNMIQDSQMP